MIEGAVFDNHIPPRQLLPQVRRTATALERMRGLLGRRELNKDEGLLISPCNSVHTFFMRYAIDVIFLDRENVVVKVVHGMKPYRLAMAVGSSSVLETRAGVASLAGIQPGDSLIWAATR